jgi:hypothetical protein
MNPDFHSRFLCSPLELKFFANLNRHFKGNFVKPTRIPVSLQKAVKECVEVVQ